MKNILGFTICVCFIIFCSYTALELDTPSHPASAASSIRVVAVITRVRIGHRTEHARSPASALAAITVGVPVIADLYLQHPARSSGRYLDHPTHLTSAAPSVRVVAIVGRVRSYICAKRSRRPCALTTISVRIPAIAELHLPEPRRNRNRSGYSPAHSAATAPSVSVVPIV